MPGLDKAYSKWLGEFEPRIRQRRLAEGLSRLAGSVAAGVFQGWQNRQRARQLQGFLSEFAQRRGAAVPEIQQLTDPELLGKLGVEATSTAVKEAMRQKRMEGLKDMAGRLLGQYGATADWAGAAATPEDILALLPPELQGARTEERSKRRARETTDALRAFIKRIGGTAPELNNITTPEAATAVGTIATQHALGEQARQRSGETIDAILGEALRRAGVPIGSDSLQESPDAALRSLEVLERYLRPYGGTTRGTTSMKRPSRELDKHWLTASGIEDIFEDLPDAMRAADILKMAAGEDKITVHLKDGKTIEVPVQWTDTLGQIVPPNELLGTQVGQIIAMRNQAMGAITKSLKSADPQDQANAIRAMQLLSLTDPTIEWQIRHSMPNEVQRAEAAAALLDYLQFTPTGGFGPSTPLQSLRMFMGGGQAQEPAAASMLLPAHAAAPPQATPAPPVEPPPPEERFLHLEFPKRPQKRRRPSGGLLDLYLSGDR